MSPVHGLAVIALTIAVLGTAHLAAMSFGDNRLSRAIVAMGI